MIFHIINNIQLTIMNVLSILEKISNKLLTSFIEINEMCKQLQQQDKIQKKPSKEIKKIEEKVENITQKEVRPKLETKKSQQKKVPTNNRARKQKELVKEDIKETKQTKKEVSKPLKKQRKSKKEIDPNRPKKPAGSYLLYLQERKPKISEQNPSLSLTEISKVVGKQWQILQQSKKNIYNNKFNQLKEQYEKDMIQYKNLHPEYEQPKRKKKTAPQEQQREISVDSNDSSSQSLTPVSVKNQEQNELDSLGDI